MKTFEIVLKRINKLLLVFVLVQFVWIYCYQFWWIKIPASYEFCVVTGEIYMTLALSIIAGYSIYLITYEIPSIMKRIAFNSQLLFSMTKIESHLNKLLLSVAMFFPIEKVRENLDKIDQINFDELYENYKMYINQMFNREITKQDFFLEIYNKTIEINNIGKNEIEKLLSFSYILEPSIFSVNFAYKASDELNEIMGILFTNKIVEEHGLNKIVPFKEIKESNIIKQVKYCADANLMLYEYLKTEYDKYR